MLPEQLLAQLRELVVMRTGLSFTGKGRRDLERRIAAAALEAGTEDVEAYLHKLLAAPLERPQVEALARHLTVGETYFFREKHSFEALEGLVLPELIRTREKAERRLRIWSAGCCTGEEAYSIAILLDRLLPGQANWDITILATDINSQFLRKARKGIYGEWSFRGTPAWVRKEYFKQKKNGDHELLPRIRERVQFSYLNLVDNSYPSLSNQANAMDIIFCRNVLMYFSNEQARQVVDKFRATLLDDGWLITSPAETSATLFSDYSAVNFPCAIFYKRNDHVASRVETRLPSQIKTATPQPVAHRTPIRPEALLRKPVKIKPATVLERKAPSAVASNGAIELDRIARTCANEGKLDEAAEWCEKATAADKLNAALYYLMATIELERGRNPSAAQALQRALYLDPNFVLAHFSLGNLRLAQGRHREAIRHFDNIRLLLGSYSRDEILPQSDGLTAGRLGEVVASLRTSLFEISEAADR